MKKAKGNLRFLSHILVFSLCLIIAVAATFAWYNRSTLASVGTAGKLTYSQSGNVSGEGCQLKTYIGTDNDGEITYDTELTDIHALTTQPGAVNYFRTVITDVSTSGNGSSLSVYLENLKYSTAMNGNVNVGLTAPEKTYKPVNSQQICLEDNIVIERNGEITVDWFIELSSSYSSSAGEIQLGNMHIVYN